VTLVDFVESTVSALVATHHPYHWIAVGYKWVALHVVVVVVALRGKF
jgi:hypothetical protein